MSSTRVPLIVVLGATGAGKSKLALELAQKFNGEVISADAMQMYKGLDIVTNKVTIEERKLVKHHMIDFLDPMLKSTIIDFRNQAIPIIEKLRSQSVTPVICGGTNYYIESLLWNMLVNEDQSESTIEPLNKMAKHENIDTSQLYSKLKEIDPIRADQIHHSERRKILRSLEVFEKTGRPHGELIEEQRNTEGGNVLGGPLRWPADELAVFWVQCDQTILDDRCDKRVDKMIDEGLIKELSDFHKNYNEKRGKEVADYTVGIFQSIGFKEFHEYLLLSEEERKSISGKKKFENGKDLMMIATRQYARRQTKWIRQRFLRRERPSPPIFGVDSSDPSKWDESVLQPATEIVEAIFEKKDFIDCRLKPMPLSRAYSYEESRQIFHCEMCKMDLRGKLQFDVHLKGRRHKTNKMKDRGEDDEFILQLHFSKNHKDDFIAKTSISLIWKVLREVTKLPLHVIKTALEKTKEKDDESIAAELRFRLSGEEGGDKFKDNLKERLIASGVTEVTILKSEDDKCTS